MAENFLIGGFEDFYRVLFKMLLDFGFKSYAVDVSAIF